MRHLPGTVLLLCLLVISGCGKQNPACAGVNPTPVDRIPEGLDQRHAANFLAGAEDLRKDGESEQAIKVLNELLTVYPESDAANEAKQILADLTKGNANAKAAEIQESEKPVNARGLLTHFPPDVKSTEAWLGHEFMVGETPIRPTEKVPRNVLMAMVGKNVEIEGIWNAGEEFKLPRPDDEESRSQQPSSIHGLTLIRGDGIEAIRAKRTED